MNEVEKMRSSQLADMSVPEIQVKFKHAKRLLAKMRVMSTYDEDYRSLLEELGDVLMHQRIYDFLCPPRPSSVHRSIATMGMVSGWVNMSLSMPIALSWTGDISRLVPIRWSVHAYRYTLPIIRWIISSVVRKRNMPIR